MPEGVVAQVVFTTLSTVIDMAGFPCSKMRSERISIGVPPPAGLDSCTDNDPARAISFGVLRYLLHCWIPSNLLRQFNGRCTNRRLSRGRAAIPQRRVPRPACQDTALREDDYSPLFHRPALTRVFTTIPPGAVRVCCPVHFCSVFSIDLLLGEYCARCSAEVIQRFASGRP
jgi:hypothetical protein